MDFDVRFVGSQNERIDVLQAQLLELPCAEEQALIYIDKAAKVLKDLSGFWNDVPVERKHEFQNVLFPRGIVYDGKKFGTPVTSMLIKVLQQSGGPDSRMVTPTGLEPVFTP